jgi:GNAT superfamily N-acetyltransferase
MRIVIVRRPVASVVDSLLALGLPDLTREMTRLDAKLQQVANRWPGAITVRYSELDDEDTCKRIFEHCLQMPHDPAWWSKLSSENIQINFAGAMRYHIAHLPQINKLMALARQTSLDLLSRRPVSPLDGVEFAVEPFERFYGDAQRAFSAHLAMTDQVPDPSLKNIDLFQRLDDAGELQCVSARHNGRIVGYLMTAIGPSLDSPGLISGWHAPFYADPAFVGLGMRLQRFSRDALRARGVNEIIMRAGVRGDGPRLGTIYRRLGAERLGEIYRLKME